MSVLATIHQPSGPLFALFDRVIVLSEGYCVYNGPPKEVAEYFEAFGLQIGRYQNPADKLSVIAQEPQKALKDAKEKTTIQILDNYSREKNAKYHVLERAFREQIIGGSTIDYD